MDALTVHCQIIVFLDCISFDCLYKRVNNSDSFVHSIDGGGGFCHGLVVSWWLGWLDTTVSGGDGGGAVRGCGLKRGKRGRRQR